MSNGHAAAIEYQGTLNLASGAGQLITTIDKTFPNRGGTQTGRLFYRVANSPSRKLRCVNVTFTGAVTQTFRVSIVDNAGVARIIASADLVGATQAFFEPEHDIWIGAGENYQVDITNNGTPAITGTISVFTEEL